MEIIFEILYELIIMGSMDIVKDSDFPMALRIGAGFILFIVFGGLLVLFLFFAWKAWKDGNIDWALFLLVLAVAWISLVVYVFRKAKKNME